MWLKGRASNDSDVYFAEMIEVFQGAFAREIRVPAHGKCQLSLRYWATKSTGADYLGSGTVPCFPKYCRVVAAMTVKALLGSSAIGPDMIDRLCQYAEAVPRDGFLIATFPRALRPYVFFLRSFFFSGCQFFDLLGLWHTFALLPNFQTN